MGFTGRLLRHRRACVLFEGCWLCSRPPTKAKQSCRPHLLHLTQGMHALHNALERGRKGAERVLFVCPKRLLSPEGRMSRSESVAAGWRQPSPFGSSGSHGRQARWVQAHGVTPRNRSGGRGAALDGVRAAPTGSYRFRAGAPAKARIRKQGTAAGCQRSRPPAQNPLDRARISRSMADCSMPRARGWNALARRLPHTASSHLLLRLADEIQNKVQPGDSERIDAEVREAHLWCKHRLRGGVAGGAREDC